MTLREPPEWVAFTILIATFPAWGPIVGLLFLLIWADQTIFKLKRRYLGPWVGRWQNWFAWHPVALDGGAGETVWLEMVQRKSIGSSYNYGVVFERLASSNHQARSPE